MALAEYFLHKVKSHFFIPRQRTRCFVCGLSKKAHTKAQVLEWKDRPSEQQSIRERAEFLAREIQNDVMAKEEEIADAIELEIRRFLI